MFDFSLPLPWDQALVVGCIVGWAIWVAQRLIDIGRTLRRIEILLQEAAREADRIIRERGK